MGAIPKNELSSDDCGQEVRKLLEYCDIIIYTLELEGVEKKVFKELFDRASRDLKIFIVRNLNKDEEIDEIKKKFIFRIKKLEEKEIRA